MRLLKDAGIFLGAFFVGMLVTAFVEKPPGQSSDWASWAQAIGTVGAIIGAYYVGERQSQAALASVAKGHAMAEHAKRRSVLAIGEAANDRAKRIGDVLKKEDARFQIYSVYDQSIITSIVGALSAVPLHDVGSREGVLAVLDLRDQFTFLGQAMEEYLAGPWKHRELGPELKKQKEGYPEYPNLVSEMLATGFSVLSRNVQTHLDEISRRYADLVAAIEGVSKVAT